MASRYQQVTDPDKAWEYYKAAVLYRQWPEAAFVVDESLAYVPYNYTQLRHINEPLLVKLRAVAGLLYVLVEDDEEQPLG